jgi:RecA/RadA recombinase
MDKNVQHFASYWRNSLADANFSKGGLTCRETQSFILCDEYFQQYGCLNDVTTQQLFQNEAGDCKTVNIVLRPIVYRNKIEHTYAEYGEVPEFIIPVATAALLARDGRCYPKSNETLISRDLLEPLVKDAFSIGSVDDLDSYLTSNIISGITYVEEDGNNQLSEEQYILAWNNYLNDVELLLNAIAKGQLENLNKFERLDNSYIIKRNIISGTARHILPLYDKLRTTSERIPLFELFAATSPTSKQPCLNSHHFFSTRLAHSGDKFPLAQAQRDALSHILNAEKGEILAVNGPPGTGKTTMLLSVVASLWAKHALEEREPPIIIAASTNNQAVTNIIDAFGKDFSLGNGVFSGRWLPNIDSFGAYFPSSSRVEQAEKSYQTYTFFKQVETSDYYEQAKNHYMQCALNAFPELEGEYQTVKDIIHKLHQAIKKEVSQLQYIEDSWKNLAAIRKTIQQKFGDNPSQTNASYKQQLQLLEQLKSTWLTAEDGWQQYLANESIWYSIFSWLPPVAKKRLLKATVHLRKIWPTDQEQQHWQNLKAISQFIENKLCSVKQSIEDTQKIIQNIANLLINLENCVNDWNTALLPLNIKQNADIINLEQADSIADTRIRFKIFLLTTHYWEGRWLLDMEDLLPNLGDWNRKNGRLPTEKRWYLRMKLTPCIVSTFYILPSKFIYTGIGYIENYLYNFADLLIVDEAGQVLPEVAGASFALSKKALVIGDTSQIEPIWSIPCKIDLGNLLAENVFNSNDIEKEFETLSELGKTASSGSVMKIAQHASRYHYDPDMAPGMFLYEHRRCYNEIINFCNQLVYKGKLQPKRGVSPENPLFPALGYLHIDGVCQRASSGSRFNKMEAQVIAKWLVENKQRLEQIYKQPIHKIVGIITPFGSQVFEIKHAIRKLQTHINVDDGEDVLTIGTVHSLQGAERKLIIFSAVYSKHANGHFIDNQPSILNVAVSRAKDSFLVFGDMDILNPNLKTPRGILANYLFACETNKLNFNYIERGDLISSGSIHLQILRNTQEHDLFLQNAVNNAKHEILIVSPWLKLAAVEHINILPLMERAVQKGIKVSVYTDIELNTLCDDKQKQPILHNEFSNMVEQFKDRGVDIKLVNKVHSKLVIKDDDLLCIGSFNWLSAQRVGDYVRHETSLCYQGKSKNLRDEIKLLKDSFVDQLFDCRIQ